MYSRIIMIKRVCSYCRSITCYDNYKESNGYWYSSITRDNKRSLYFLCSNCMQSKPIKIQNGIRLTMLRGKKEKG